MKTFNYFLVDADLQVDGGKSVVIAERGRRQHCVRLPSAGLVTYAPALWKAAMSGDLPKPYTSQHSICFLMPATTCNLGWELGR